MAENKNIAPEGEIKDEALDSVAGGGIRRTGSTVQTVQCKGCTKYYSPSNLCNGYCKNCCKEKNIPFIVVL